VDDWAVEWFCGGSNGSGFVQGPRHESAVGGSLVFDSRGNGYTTTAVYAHTYVFSDRDRDALLRVDSNDGNRAWLNGELVSSDQVVAGRGLHDRTNETPVRLKAGWNRLLLQVENRFGRWAAVAQLTAPNRQPLRDLTCQLANPFPERGRQQE
jgi:hypothetical protein